MKAEAVETAHKQYGGHILGINGIFIERLGGWYIGKGLLQVSYTVPDFCVMPADEVAKPDNPRGDNERNPSSLAELFIDSHTKNRKAKDQTYDVDYNMLFPFCISVAVFQKETDHA